ncbi:unnamed protein product [Penicillium egyptiacum]|uniref:Uncharacterized protein n=1 Tax=Penicillium egyptiacum TaxID=1303716 RepID=A0A9W4KKB0_9EURO|nr:unnamed protein product [Penicillium egyptiacum]
MPLQQIVGAYLEIIEEGKVKTSTKIKEAFSQFFPWEYYQYTQRDVDKSITTFTRLLDAIECRIPFQSAKIDIQYPQSVLDEAFTPKKSFVRSFLSALPRRQVYFRYIAPGLRLQSVDEFKSQPFAAHSAISQNDSDDEGEEIPFLLFRADGSNLSPWGQPFNNVDTPAGLYTEDIDKGRAQDFGNMCRLLFPFGIGSKGYARDITGRQIGFYGSPITPIDHPQELYQVCDSNGSWRLMVFDSIRCY